MNVKTHHVDNSSEKTNRIYWIIQTARPERYLHHVMYYIIHISIRSYMNIHINGSQMMLIYIYGNTVIRNEIWGEKIIIKNFDFHLSYKIIHM